MRGAELPARRGLDVALAVVMIWVTLPAWICVALAIRLTSGGPVLYAGRRVGKDGEQFLMYKFRTMRADADRAGPGITAAGDPRVTRVGRVLRATKLDELPQLLNVVRGEMSLVGPRPEAPEYVALYDRRQRRVLTVRPGVTGPTQLAYRHEEQLLRHADVDRQYRLEVLPRKLETDLAYLESRSLRGDVILLFATLGRLFSREG